jgi:hypothetical protein
MARAGVCLALVLAGCGLASKDYDVELPFQAGGGPPSFTGSFNSTQLLGPLSADVSKVSTVTLKAARIEATDNNGDISFVSGATISVSSRLLPDALLATLPAPPAAGANSAQLQVAGKELKPYLQAGGTVAASISYSPTPVNARELKLVLTIHGSLF